MSNDKIDYRVMLKIIQDPSVCLYFELVTGIYDPKCWGRQEARLLPLIFGPKMEIADA